MEINLVGLAAALATFFGVWLGHVSVRKIERETVRLWIPTLIALVSGFGLWLASTLTSSLPLSAASGILGVTLLWDALEIYIRQPRRIRHGHAPANPNNPRHTRILAEYPEATTVDLLDRDPIGRPFTAHEITALKEGVK
ncbi:MAG: DUF4491 family protein [Anaerolineales bacterium]|nr:DUF4491 family protein [Anaerolineales bacterium]